jgi:hypothetical protein
VRLLYKGTDGGPNSGVTGYWLIEWKSVFSVVLLHFASGSREAFHSHALNAWTWWLRGRVLEFLFGGGEVKAWTPSVKPKRTLRSCFHRVVAGPEGAWAISFRGPWQKTWNEHKNGETYELSTPGRART